MALLTREEKVNFIDPTGGNPPVTAAPDGAD